MVAWRYRDNFEKGYALEEFITKLFSERGFHVKQWLKAGKRADHLPWADLTNPDLQIELLFTGARKYRFAVKCEWRRECIDGMIKWAEVLQIYNYERLGGDPGEGFFMI